MRQKRNYYTKKKGVAHYFLYFFLCLLVVVGTVIGMIALGWMQVEQTPLKSVLGWAGIEWRESAAENSGGQADEDAAPEEEEEQPSAGSDTDTEPVHIQPEPPVERAMTRDISGVTLGSSSGSLIVEGEAARMLARLDGFRIPSQGVFSMHDWAMSSADGQRADDQVVSQMASFIYEAALRTGLDPVERYIHAELPPGMKEGFDVRYEHGIRDFSVYNPLAFDVTLHVALDDQTAAVSFAGEPTDDWQQPVIAVSQAERFAPHTILLIDHLGGTGRNVVDEGGEGMLIKVYRTFNGQDESLVSKDFYAPRPVIVTQAPAQGGVAGSTDIEG